MEYKSRYTNSAAVNWIVAQCFYLYNRFFFSWHVQRVSWKHRMWRFNGSTDAYSCFHSDRLLGPGSAGFRQNKTVFKPAVTAPVSSSWGFTEQSEASVGVMKTTRLSIWKRYKCVYLSPTMTNQDSADSKRPWIHTNPFSSSSSPLPTHPQL